MPATYRSGRSRLGRPYRRLRRWVRHTTNTDIALTLVALGALLLLVAFILLVTVV